MWNRAELKGKAKFSFKRNYWKSVLISLLLALIVGGGGLGKIALSYGYYRYQTNIMIVYCLVMHLAGTE